MKIGQKDKRGVIWTRARQQAINAARKAHIAAGRSRRNGKRPMIAKRTSQPDVRAAHAARHAFKFNVHLAELVRLIVRDELVSVLRRIR